MDSTYWFFFLALVFLAGCFQTRDYSSHYDPYGGQDVVYVDLPFAAGYQSQCVQGVGGEYSHMLECTLYDIDMDTPNDRDDLVFAPASGTVYVHSESLTSGFGLHINLDLGDGTYIILGHLDYVFVSSGQQVTAGEILAFEGTTGYSTGDHVHMGRHLGDASLGGGSGTSVMGLGLHVRDTSGFQQEDLLTYEMWCDLAWGHRYESQLQVAMWHPDGALLTTPYDGNIYRKERGALRRFYSEDHMLMSGQDYDDVILISGEEFSCYSIGTQLKDEFVGARIDQDDNVWLLYENRTDGVRERRMVPQQAWSEILQSWGFGLDYIAKLDSEGASLSTFDMVDEYAVFRDGTLLTEVGKSDVYFVSGKVAMPIVDWDTYLLMGLWNHEIIQVQPGVVESVFMRVGDCTTGKWCITRSNVLDCGYDFADLYTELDDSQDDKEDSDDNDSGGDDEDDQDTDVPVDDSTGELRVVWRTPHDYYVDSATLSGEYITSGGVSSGWQVWEKGSDTRDLEVAFPSATVGDSFRFSVEYRDGSSVGWSCIAPFPPGTVNGDATATWDGKTQHVLPNAAPGSDGCELFLRVE